MSENKIAKQEENPIKEFFAHESVVKKFRETIGNKAPAFLTSVLQVVNGNDQLQKCLPKTIFNAAMTAATMDLPINQNLGFAWIIGYKDRTKGMVAQFQMGYKGFVQLAMRSGQYLRLNCIPVFKNQFKSWNELTEELVADFSIPGEGDVVGYCGYFKLINGFEKTVYWTMKKIDDHARKFSKNYENEHSLWKTDFDSMARKTVLKNMLNKWGILSIEMQKAIAVDQAVINNEDGSDFTYPDSTELSEEEKKRQRAASATDETLNMMNK